MVYRTWRAYLDSKHGHVAANAGTPSPLWLAVEQAKWPMYDLAGFYVPEGAVPQVLTIRRANSSGAPAYEIVTRFRPPGPAAANADPTLSPTITVYAVADGQRWFLENALSWRTRSWYSETVGQITYFIDPTLHFDRAKARAAVSFVDSLASAFGVPRLGPLDYYVASTGDVAFAIIGVAYTVKFGATGGFSKPVNHQLFSGIPTLGEDYRHELTHLVLRPLFQGAMTTILASEGAATWLGGSGGADFATTVRGFASFLATHPHVTLDSIIGPDPNPNTSTYPAGAVLCAMLFDRVGVGAVKEFLLAGPGPADLRAALVHLLGKPWASIATDWRKEVDRIAAQPGVSR